MYIATELVTMKSAERVTKEEFISILTLMDDFRSMFDTKHYFMAVIVLVV